MFIPHKLFRPAFLVVSKKQPCPLFFFLDTTIRPTMGVLPPIFRRRISVRDSRGHPWICRKVWYQLPFFFFSHFSFSFFRDKLFGVQSRLIWAEPCVPSFVQVAASIWALPVLPPDMLLPAPRVSPPANRALHRPPRRPELLRVLEGAILSVILRAEGRRAPPSLLFEMCVHMYLRAYFPLPSAKKERKKKDLRQRAPLRACTETLIASSS